MATTLVNSAASYVGLRMVIPKQPPSFSLQPIYLLHFYAIRCKTMQALHPPKPNEFFNTNSC